MNKHATLIKVLREFIESHNTVWRSFTNWWRGCRCRLCVVGRRVIKDAQQ